MMDNYEAEGYMILALHRAGFNIHEIKKVKRELWHLFDVKSESEAEEQGSKLYERLSIEKWG
jgi:hypothetical protein